MNKTISINISGLNFIIEEEAYFKLQNYLDEIKKHCGTNADVEEVISDIELGIAEKLKSLLNEYKEVITTKDIESLIKVMGTPDDFDREVGATHEERKSDSKVKRKLYRNPDDVVVGGVASGLGVYFDVDPVIFRVIFILLTFMSGFGVLAYIVLWISMPEAKNANQKLEMRGEAPTIVAFENLSKLEKKIEKSWKERWSKYSIIEKIVSLPILIIGGIFDFIKKVLSVIVPIFRFLLGLFLVCMSLIGLGVVGVGSLYLLLQIHSAYSLAFVPISLLVKTVPFIWLIITGFLSLAIPAILFLMSGIILLLKKNFFTFNIGVILVSIWMIAGISFCAICLRYYPDFKDKITNYPSIQTISKNVDISKANKIIVNGSYFDIDVIPEKGGETFLSGRIVDIDRVNMVNKENGDLLLTWSDVNNDLCLNCSNEPVKLIVSKENLSKIKVENGATLNIIKK